MKINRNEELESMTRLVQAKAERGLVSETEKERLVEAQETRLRVAGVS